VPTDDLSSVPGLEDKHLRALARQQITDLRSFADADQREIYKTMANIRPRPSLERISRWQEEARSRLEVAETDVSDWPTVASFSVIFGERQVGDIRERRVEVERTEVEPEQERQARAGWDFEPVGRWMADQLAAIDSASPPAPPVAAQPGAAPPAGAKAPGRSQLQIKSAAITDANGTVSVIRDSGRRAGRRGALGADRASTRGSHGQRRTARDSTTSGDPYPSTGRTGLESPGPCGSPAFAPSRV
jgi:hypothetical protein